MKKTKPPKIILAILVIIVFASLLLLLFNNKSNPTKSSDKKVATTIFPLHDIIKNIAGDEIEVVLILKPGASPHTFDPSPKEVKELSGSQAIFAIGHGLDDWTLKLSESVGIKKIITTDKNIDLITTENYDHHEDSGNEHEHGSVDPHYWLSVKNSILIANQVATELCDLFPEYCEAFESNLNDYQIELEQLNSEMNQQLNTLANKNIATFHSAWNYFARDHGIKIVTTFEEYPGKEPTPQYLAEFQDKVKQSKVKVIFAEPQFSTNELEPIANDLGIAISILDPLGGSSGKSSYVKLMRYNVNQIITALQ